MKEIASALSANQSEKTACAEEHIQSERIKEPGEVEPRFHLQYTAHAVMIFKH